jgi:preprotein translocase subunit SecD
MRGLVCLLMVVVGCGPVAPPTQPQSPAFLKIHRVTQRRQPKSVALTWPGRTEQIWVDATAAVTDHDVTHARVGSHPLGICVKADITDEARQRLHRALFPPSDVSGEAQQIALVLDGTLLSAPFVRDEVPRTLDILHGSGFTQPDAEKLVARLRRAP